MNRQLKLLPCLEASREEAEKNAAGEEMSWALVRGVAYLNDVLQNLLVDDRFVARGFMVQIYHHIQGPLSKGHIV